MPNQLSKLYTAVQPEYFFWLAMCGLFFLFFSGGAKPVLPARGAEAAVLGARVPLKENPYDPYENLTLEAKAVSVYDVKRKMSLFEKNAKAILPLASITKIMTALTALSLVPETTDITVSTDALKAEGDSKLKAGERWGLRNLLTLTLIESSNDGAVAVASTIGGFLATSTEDFDAHRRHFVAEMNREARAIGLTATSFESESGLDLNTERAGAYSTAHETTLLLAYALEKSPSLFTETHWSELALQGDGGVKRSAKNTNTDTNKLPLLIASKTGYTDLAGGNLVIAFDAGFGHPIIIAVLGSTMDGRFTDVEKLVWATLEYLAKQ